MRLWRTRVAAVLAMVGAVLLSTGLVVMAAPTASAEGKEGQGQDTCDDLGYTKIDQASGDSSFDWGTLTWGDHAVSYTVKPGHTLALCAKSGTHLDQWSNLTGSGTKLVTVQQSISHIGFTVSTTPPPTVTAVAPSVSLSARCEVEGSYTIPDTAGVGYRLDGAYIAPGTYPGPKTGTITAVASGDAVLSNPGFSFALNVPAAEDCPTPPVSTAVAPEVKQSTACGVQGSYTIPATTGVQYKLDGSDIAAGTYPGPASGTVTAVATGNHVLANPAFSFALSLPAAAVCESSSPSPSVEPGVGPTEEILGTESVKPKPNKQPTKQPGKKPGQSGGDDEPVVLGTEAAVPTAVDAGLGSLPAAAPAPGGLLGGLLTAGGAALMLAAGWLMAGRRQPGAREA